MIRTRTASPLTDETIYVADAGANSVVSVDTASGETETVAVLPPRPYKITTDVCGLQRPAGLRGGNDLRLRGRPDRCRRRGVTAGCTSPRSRADRRIRALGARGAIFKVDPDGDEVELVADDIMTPTGLALADNGDMYVASLFGDGVLKIDPDSGEQTVVLAAGFTADVDLRGDTLYATVNALPGPDGPARRPGDVPGARTAH